MDDVEWSDFVNGLRAGQPDACRTFWQQFGSAMKELAERRISPTMRRRVDSEDVVQSVCRTFFRRAREGQFLIEDDNDLWRLLCAITVAKTRMHIRHHKRQRRDVSSEKTFDSTSGVGPTVSDLVDKTPSPDEQVAFADQFRHVMEQLGDEESTVIELKLQQLGNGEIAEQLGCAERTVRRILARVRQRLETETASLLK